MTRSIYKFEQYPNRNFPIYSSLQQNKALLIAPHFHDDMEFIFVCSGAVTFSIGAEKYHCKNNEIIYISPDTIHQAVSDTADASIRGFVFHPSILKPYFSDDKNLFTCGNGTIFAKENPYYGELYQLFTKITTVYDCKPSTYKLDITAHILMLVSTLVRSGTAFCKTKDDTYSRIEPAIRYIEENYNKKISISDLSRIINVCDDHFIRIFKAATSCTPTVYITDVRLHQALRLLALHKYSISEVSDLAGFSNIQYFSRIFKERLGISPSDYLKIEGQK